MKYTTWIIAAIVLSGCVKQPENRKEQPIARVFANYLYPSDLHEVIPAGLAESDSAAMAGEFIEKWVRNQLLLNKAELNLTDAEKDVRLQMESYRSSLLIYAYQQSYLKQKLDTVVSDKEIEDYYKQNNSNFILNGTLFKGVFIKLPANAPEIWKVRQWCRNSNADNVKNLEAYCFEHAAVYDDFDEEWIRLNEVLQRLPANSGNNEAAVKSYKFLESRDNAYHYFVSAKEIALEGTVSPFETVKNDILYIILNKRKIMLINELEMNIYSDAQNHEYFTIYQK